MSLHLFSVQLLDAEEPQTVMVWARDAAGAATAVAKMADADGVDHEDLGVRMVEPVAGWTPAQAGPHIEARPGALRDHGWGYFDDRRCECCGLAEMAGRWPVCSDCGWCVDCGHDDDCPGAPSPEPKPVVVPLAPTRKGMRVDAAALERIADFLDEVQAITRGRIVLHGEAAQRPGRHWAVTVGGRVTIPGRVVLDDIHAEGGGHSLSWFSARGERVDRQRRSDVELEEGQDFDLCILVGKPGRYSVVVPIQPDPMWVGYRLLELGAGASDHGPLLRGLHEHLRELGRRYYRGEVAATDDLLQLWSLDEGRDAAVKAAALMGGDGAGDSVSESGLPAGTPSPADPSARGLS